MPHFSAGYLVRLSTMLGIFCHQPECYHSHRYVWMLLPMQFETITSHAMNCGRCFWCWGYSILFQISSPCPQARYPFLLYGSRNQRYQAMFYFLFYYGRHSSTLSFFLVRALVCLSNCLSLKCPNLHLVNAREISSAVNTNARHFSTDIWNFSLPI